MFIIYLHSLSQINGNIHFSIKDMLSRKRQKHPTLLPCLLYLTYPGASSIAIYKDTCFLNKKLPCSCSYS